VVASLGTAFTDYQLKQLLRYTPSKQVILNFDADKAGIKATERAIAEVKDLVYAGQVQLRVLNLPGGKDADEFISSRDDAVAIYRDSVDNAPLWLDWQINNLIAGKNLKAADEMQQVAKKIVKLLNRLQDANQRNYYLNRCAEILSQGDGRLVPQNLANLKSQLTPEFRKKSSLKNNKKQVSLTSKPAFNIATNPEEELLEQAESLLLLIYIHCPRYREEVITKLEDKDLFFSLAKHRFLWQEIITIERENTNNKFSSHNFILEQLHNRSVEFSEEMQALNSLLYLDEKTQEDVFRAAARIENAIASLEQVSCIKYQLYCTEQLTKINPLVDGNKIKHLYEEIQYSKKRIQELEIIRLSAES
jgi:DNA primase